MARVKIPRECKVAGQRLAIACDAAGLSELIDVTTKIGGKKILGMDRCDYPAPGSPVNAGTTPGMPVVEATVSHRCRNGKPSFHVFIEIQRTSTTGAPGVFKPGSKKGTYTLDTGKGDEAGYEQLWKNANALARTEKLIDDIKPADVGAMFGVAGMNGESGIGIAIGYIYGFNRFTAELPGLKSKRDAAASGKKFKDTMDAFVQKLS